MAGAYNHFKLRSTSDLVGKANRLMDEIEAGKRIESGSGGGKSASYQHDSADERKGRLDDLIEELQSRALAGDTDVPKAYRDITAEPTEIVADFSQH